MRLLIDERDNFLLSPRADIVLAMDNPSTAIKSPTSKSSPTIPTSFGLRVLSPAASQQSFVGPTNFQPQQSSLTSAASSSASITSTPISLESGQSMHTFEELYLPGALLLNDEGVALSGILVGLSVIDFCCGLKDSLYMMDRPVNTFSLSN
ncbi:unnamed protein product [Protopolystoma xenopodis]|uniref:Uncharacterized protein n=1 Tax=Protopolystoma xenopodis TaxID=117903 RepID=A0A3S5B8J3_9PLAT|nr:unnamed protein product [Protopolystoma xenopodis]